jgi:hypothetical protein
MDKDKRNIAELYTHHATILDVFGERGSGDALLKINNLKLKVFLPNFRYEGWQNIETYGPNKSLIGKEVMISLWLFVLNIRKVKSSVDKKIAQKAYGKIPEKSSDNYKIIGVVKEAHKLYYIVDCGIDIIVDKPIKSEFFQGDTVGIEGRLDAYRIDISNLEKRRG